MADKELTYAPAYRREDLRLHKLRGAFADKPHDVYVAYDESMDQLIVRLIDPRIPASEYFINDHSALLVRDSDRVVIGLTILGFQAKFLAERPELRMTWTRSRLTEHFSHYLKMKYEPRENTIKEPDKRDQQAIVTYTALRSRAEATLVPA
jgi:hypothetical protein